MTTLTSSVLDLCRPEVRALPAYNAGVSERVARAKYKLARVTRLASNENPLGAGPMALAALVESLGRVHRYPDPACAALRLRLQEHCGVDADRIVIGNGSEEIIEGLCKALLAPGDRVVTLAPSFGLHEIFPQMMGARVDKVGVDAQFEYDLPAWQRALARPAKLVMFSTPSNPVGCILNPERFKALIDACPDDALLAIDEAYCEYAAGPDYPDSVRLLSAQSRPWIVLRTFSKAYGLAGLRVGYGIASERDLVAVLDRVRTPFNVNGAAQAAAIAALDDTGHLRDTIAACHRERAVLIEQLRSLDAGQGLGLRIAPSRGNFLFIDTTRSGRDIADALMQRGVIVKPWLEAGFDTFIRVSIGKAEDGERFLEALVPALAAVPAVRRA